MIQRTTRGLFTARIGARDIRGWSATVEEMQAILGRFGLDATDAGSAISREIIADNKSAPTDCELELPQDQRMHQLRAAADGPQRALLREALVELRDTMPTPGPHAARMKFVPDPDPGAELQAWLSERAAGVNASAPQVGQIAVFGSAAVPQKDSGSAARAEYLDWIDPTPIVSTADLEWGMFKCADPTRRSLAEVFVALHQATTPAELEAWIERRWIGGGAQPVKLVRVEGSAGPIYSVGSDGNHRVHFARIFGLPLLALVRTSPLPDR
ncbi:hypothetical protein [Nocardia sp. NPDC003979]